MTTENNTDGFNVAAGKDALALFNTDDPDFNPDILAYADSTGEKRARQDKIIAAINAAMESGNFTEIAAIDKEPAEKLTQSSKDIIKAIENSTAFLGGFGRFKNMIKELDFDGMGELAEKISASVVRKAELATYNPLVRWLFALFTRGPSNSDLEALSNKSRQTLLKMGEAIADLEESQEQIPDVEQSLDAQEEARLEFYSDYGLYIGAVLEAYRRWKEEELPELRRQAKETRSPLDLRNLRVKERGTTYINAKATSMSTLHTKSLVDLNTIDRSREALSDTAFSIQNHLTSSQAQWHASVAENLAAGKIAQMVDTVHEVDELSDEILADNAKLSNLISMMASASLEHGTNDANQVIEMMKEEAERVVREAEEAIARSERLEATRAELNAAKDLVLEAKMKAIDMALQEAREIEEEIRLLEHQPLETVDVDAELAELAPENDPIAPSPGQN